MAVHIDINNKINKIPDISWNNYLPKVFLIGLFFISPLLSLPFIFVEIYNKKRYAQTLLALFMGFASWLFPPIYDSYRHYLTFFEVNSNPYFFDENFGAKFDFILLSLDQLYGKIGLSFEVVKFTLSFIAYEIVFWLFRDILKRNPNLEKNYFLIFVFFFLSVPFIDITVGIRQVSASFFFILGIYLLFYKNKFGYIFALLSIFMHYSFLLYIIPFVILAKKRFQISNKKTFTLIFLIFIFFNPVLINILLSHLPLSANMFALADAYLNGYYSTARTEGRNLNYMFFFWLTKIDLFIYIYLCIKEKNNGLTGLSKFAMIFLAFDLCLSYILFGRFIIIFGWLTRISILQNSLPFLRKWISLLVCLGCIIFVGALFPYRNVISSSKEYNLALPVPFILTSEYTERWIYLHYDDEGFPR